MANKPVVRDFDKYLDLYPTIDKKQVKEKFKYDEDTGRVYRVFKDQWKVCKRLNMYYPGRYVCRFKGVLLEVPHIAWLLCYGDWPKEPIAALSGDLYDTHKENMVAESTTKERLGNYLIAPYRDDMWQVKVWHHPYFYRGSSFKNKYIAEKWAEKQLKLYNLYASYTEASALNTSEDDIKETPIIGVYFHKPRNLYMVKVKVNGKFSHYSYEKNIEDAIDAQKRGQKEVDEIWQE